LPNRYAPEVTIMAENFLGKISLSNLIDGFANYSRTVLSIVQHPFKFPETLEVDGEEAYRNALNLVLYSITLIFFLLVPVFAKHSTEVTKITFLLRFLTQFAMYGALMHLSLKFLGGSKKNVKASLVLYSHIVIIGAPLAIVLEYPILLSFGPAALFGTPNDMFRLVEYYQYNPDMQIYAVIMTVILSVLSFLIVLNWYHKIHLVGRFRVFLCVLLAGAIGAIVQIFVLNPVFLAAFEWINGLLKYA
jgi:hypothetical protein